MLPPSHPHHLLQKNHREHPHQLYHCLVWDLRGSTESCAGSRENRCRLSLCLSPPIFSHTFCSEGLQHCGRPLPAPHICFLSLCHPAGGWHVSVHGLPGNSFFFPEAVRLLYSLLPPIHSSQPDPRLSPYIPLVPLYIALVLLFKAKEYHRINFELFIYHIIIFNY